MIFPKFSSIILLSFLVAIKAQRPISYIGCYSDRIEARDIYERDYTRTVRKLGTTSIAEACIDLCAKDGYYYAAVQS